MSDHNTYDVIIVGGSYSGLAAGMALGRALKKVLIIDDGKPCNRQTPYSHNFITHDGHTPREIAALANLQVNRYETVKFFYGLATSGSKTALGYDIQVATGESFTAKRLIFATGIRDIMPAIDGFAACWGISMLHCPYCHGYEVRHEPTGLLGNGETGFDLARLISNWTNDLTLFTNGASTLTFEQTAQLDKHSVRIVEKEIEQFEHSNGHLSMINFRDGTTSAIKVIYAPVPFEQQCSIPESLGCELTAEGYIQVDPFHETSVKGVFACGDNVTRMRTVANAVGMGTTTGITVSKNLILEEF
ncbi:NAD(P)/FAD-dependent oxidoreductase [Flavihumibacter fluvii]|uniref:NAD(P)/FAD-dependent oxidoreductase n=1 Tax=Flavihumibacter fluvii TaxID=2838157 RepID=UPI001EFA2CD9|nr:NAD(P)/FAD-dependent oxidoreductase [Flavihumibacter fluvii]ULQ50934.1 NAD(P)/FAD-dependent oxidoreductase [Flavihumibacter fluvii]